MWIPKSITARTGLLVVSVLASAVAGCGPKKPDYSKNEGAVAWLAYHHGTIPSTCISQLVEKYGTSAEISPAARQKAEADAMQIAGSTYAISLASEHLIVAREKELELAKEGVAKGYVTESGLLDAITNLNKATFDLQMSRTNLAGLDACDFTATDKAFGFKYRPQLSYYSATH